MTSILDIPPPGMRRSWASRKLWKNHTYRAKQVESGKRSHSPEHMRKMLEASKSEESLRKRSESMKARYLDVRLREKRRQAWTPERRRKHSENMKELHAKGVFPYKNIYNVRRGGKLVKRDNTE